MAGAAINEDTGKGRAVRTAEIARWVAVALLYVSKCIAGHVQQRFFAVIAQRAVLYATSSNEVRRPPVLYYSVGK